ncbi:MAG: type II toxin-antitoxin system PemK/MazF family toxin [Waddliaceae bacterium]
MKKTNIRRGDIYRVNFDPSKGTEMKKTRPSLICSHDIMNENSSRVIVAPITSNMKKVYSFEFFLKNHAVVEGKVMLDQIRSIDKSRLGDKLENLSIKEMEEIDDIIKFILGVQ